jgi:hypothetical protein
MFCPWFPQNESNYKYKPETEVYVPVLLEEDIFSDAEGLPLMADCAWVTENGAKSHFWFHTSGMKAEVQKMTVKEFLDKFDWVGMNPFQTLNGIEFRTKYWSIHGGNEGRK